MCVSVSVCVCEPLIAKSPLSACFEKCRGQRVSLHGLCQRSSVKLRQVNAPAVVDMGTLVQLVATNIVLCGQCVCMDMSALLACCA